jgi:hypothetical protein
MKAQLHARQQTQRENMEKFHKKQREKSKEYQEKMRRKHAEIVKYHERNPRKSKDSDSSDDEDFMEKMQKMREMMWQKKSGASFHDHKNEEEDDPNGTWRDVESPRTKKARPGKKGGTKRRR